MIDDDVMQFAVELTRKGADIRAKDEMARSVLWHACCRSWLKSIPWLVGFGLDINDRDREGTSAFDAGCLHGERINVEAMLAIQPEIDAQDANGDTALIKCARKRIETKESPVYSSIIALINAGADPDIENYKGESFRKLAENDPSLKCLLFRYKGK